MDPMKDPVVGSELPVTLSIVQYKCYLQCHPTVRL